MTAEPGGNFTVEGDFTIRNVTRRINAALRFTGAVKDSEGNTRIAFQTKTKVNRKDFGLLALLEQETGGFPIGKDVSIKTAIEAILKK